MAKKMPFLRANSSVLSGTRTNTTITAPAGIKDGDILRIYFELTADPGPPVSVTPPSGFVELASDDTLNALGGSGVGDLRARIWEKVALNESGDYTVTHNNASSIAYMEVVANCLAASDFAATENPVNENGTNYTATGGTTTQPNTWVTFCSMCWEDGSPFSPPSGSTPTFTELFDPATGFMYIASGVMLSPGSTGNKTATGNSQATTGGQVGFLTSLLSDYVQPVSDLDRRIINLISDPSGYLNKVKSSRNWF
jgi:hypothetical protein